MKSVQFLCAFILAAACVFCAAGLAQADVILVDRGLPTFGVFAVDGGGNTDWSHRSNIGCGDYDSKDPIWAANPSWGPPEIPSDDFTMPTGPLGPNPYQINDIRLWIEASSTLSFGDEFNSIGLMLGPKNGTLTNLGITPTVTKVQYPNGQSPTRYLWQLDFAVNLTATSGQGFTFAILPDGKACSNASGNGESYYIAFAEAVMQFAQKGHNPSGDGYVGDYYTNGTLCDSFTFPAVWGGVQAGDLTVQVFGTHAPASYAWAPVLPGTYSWGDSTKWISIPGEYPNSIDAIATFNKAIECVGDDSAQYENVYLNGSVTVGSLTVHNGGAYQGNSSGTYDFGDGHGSQYVIYAGTGGSLNFEVSGGTALLKVYGYDSYGEPAWTLRAPINLVSDTVIDTANVNPAGFNLYNSPANYGGGIIFDASTCPLGGSGALIKTGPNALWIMSTNNPFTGDVSVRDGYLLIGDQTSLGTGTSAISLGGPGTFGHLADAFIPWNWWAAFNITRPLTLTGDGGYLHANYNYLHVQSAIGGTGMLILGKSNGNIYFDNNVDNTFVGQTRVQGHFVDVSSGVTARLFTGDVVIEDGGLLRLNAANNVGGTVTVNSALDLSSPLANVLMSWVGVKGDFFPTLTSTSFGGISIDQDTGSSPTFNAALAVGSPQIGNGYMFYGVNQSSGVFRGTSLQPSLDNVYRFAIGYNAYLALAANGPGVLADVGGNAASVEVSKASVDGGGWQTLRTYDANSFTGSLTIHSLACFTGNTQSGGSPFGSATGAVQLSGGYLELQNGGGDPVTKGATTFQSQSMIGLSNATLTLNTLTRQNNGMLSVRPMASNDWNSAGLSLGVNDKLLVANSAPAVTNGMVAPYYMEDFGRYFLTYDNTNGFMPATFTVTGNATGGGAFASSATDIVNLPSGGTISGAQSAYAVRVTGAPNDGSSLKSSGPGDVLTIGSGGLILATTMNGTWVPVNHTANINFGGTEGIVYLAPSTQDGHPYDWWDIQNQLSGTITGTGGLTIGAYVNGNHAPSLEISGNNTGLSGQITINQCTVAIDNANALGSGTIYLNGRPSLNGDVAGAALVVNYNGTVANNIVLGPEGGTLSNGWWTNISFTGQISGTGPLTLTGTHDNQIWLSNTSSTAPNNYTGGTWVAGTNVFVADGATMGTGPIVVGGAGDGGTHLFLNGNTNVGPAQRVIIQDSFFGDTVGVYIQCGAPTFGSIEGNGKLYFNTNSTLTVGGNNASTDFFGNILDGSQIWTNYNWKAGGSLVKTGSGTLTLWGDVLLSGYWPASWYQSPAVTVNQGTLVINGTLGSPEGTGWNSGVTVNTNGTLSGSGVINKALTVSGGTANFTGAVVNGPVTMSGGAYSGTSTINGNDVEVSGGTFSGTHTINLNTDATGFPGWSHPGSIEVAGGTFGGNNTITAPGGVYTDRDEWWQGGTIQGSGTINGNVYIWTGTYNGTHTIHGDVEVQDYWYWDRYYPIASTFAGSATIYGNVTLGTHNPGSYMYAGNTSPDSTSNTSNSPITFKGNHTIHGNLTVAAGNTQPITIAPSNTTTAAQTLTVIGNVALDSHTTLSFNLGAAGTIGGGVNDLIAITGDLTLDGTLNVNALGGFNTGTYTLVSYTGALTDNGLVMGANPGSTYLYEISTATAHQVNLVVTTAHTPFDTNGDGVVNAADIDQIYNIINARNTFHPEWSDVNNDSLVNQADVTWILNSHFKTSYADGNLDTFTDFSDFQILLDHWQGAAGWATGDWTGDQLCDFSDFQKLLDYWNPTGWSFAQSQVPEPASLSLLALGALALLRRRKA